jgi:hypothetical protein
MKKKEISKVKFAKFKRVVDTRMHNAGEIDESKKLIRVNPRKGDLINTIIHEELHKQHWDKPEKWIKKKASEQEKSLTIAGAVKLLKKFQEKRNAN